jgi:hypothetical protein
MKKVFVVACLSIFVLASCKKNYTCECASTSSSPSSQIEIKDAKKGDAEDACSALSTSSTSVGGGACTLK